MFGVLHGFGVLFYILQLLVIMIMVLSLRWIDGVDVAPGISRTVISYTSSSLWITLKESLQNTFHQPKGFQEKPICVIENSNRLVVGSVVLVARIVVGYALNLVGLPRLVESLESPTYEYVVEYSEPT